MSRSIRPVALLCTTALTLVLMASSLSPLSAQGVARESVLFETTAQVPPGESAFVLGDLPELGGGDVRRAVGMVKSPEGAWRLRVSLPANREYSYQYLSRKPGSQLCSATNGTPLSDRQFSTTSPAPVKLTAKVIFYRGSLAQPVVSWRQGAGDFQVAPMLPAGPGREPGERTWRAVFGFPGRSVELFLSDGSGTREPAAGTFLTLLDAAYVQDGALFSYIPAAQVSPPRRDYAPEDPPAIDSAILAQRRGYRVLLPRGYDEHTERRYPVLYFHEGNRIFDTNEWTPPLDLDGKIVSGLIARGEVREAIFVGVDYHLDPRLDLHQNRARDYLPPGDTDRGVAGQADRYARFIAEELKPAIDARYRTLPGVETTCTAGYSYSGVTALYFGWDFTATFGRVGSWSGSFWLPNFTSRLLGDPVRPVRVYLDSGDDNYDGTLAVRTALVGASPPFSVEGSLRYRYACGQSQHTASEWATRLPDMLSFLLPAAEEESKPDSLSTLCLAPSGELDVDGDGLQDICEPDCNWNSVPDDHDLATGASRDVDLDLVPDECQPDCNRNSIPDTHDLATAASTDCDLSGIPDECEIASGASSDCNENGIPDGCETGPFAMALREEIEGVDGAVFLGPPDGISVGLGAGAATFDLGFARVVDEPGADFSVYEDGTKPGVERRFMDALVSADGNAFASVKSTEQPLVRVRGDEGYSAVFWARSYDLAGSGLAEVRYIRIQGLGTGAAGSEAGFDLDAVGLVHYRACVPKLPPFRRGDTNADVTLDMSDAIAALGFLFLGSQSPSCADAADANDSGEVDLSDAVFTLGYLFLGTAAPPEPFDACGPDATADGLGCDAFEACR